MQSSIYLHNKGGGGGGGGHKEIVFRNSFEMHPLWYTIDLLIGLQVMAVGGMLRRSRKV